MKKVRLLVLGLILIIIAIAGYKTWADKIYCTNNNTYQITVAESDKKGELSNTDNMYDYGYKDASDIKRKSIILIVLFVLAIASKCIYTAVRLRFYDKM